jgi:hypothetical protein
MQVVGFYKFDIFYRKKFEFLIKSEISHPGRLPVCDGLWV